MDEGNMVMKRDKIQVFHIMNCLKQEGSWIDWQYKTRDHLLCGDVNQEVKKVGVCWVATNQAIEQAIAAEVDLIISHENPFYMTSTAPMSQAWEMAEIKRKKLYKANISVIRCHDVWDCIEKVGVADQWAASLGFDFEPRQKGSYLHFATIPKMSAEQLGQHVANCLREFGGGCSMLGRRDKQIQRIAIGTGAATDVYRMLEEKPDALIVADDGVTNYNEGQLLLDMDKTMIVVNHAVCEIRGIRAMVPWLAQQFPELLCLSLEEGYQLSVFQAEK